MVGGLVTDGDGEQKDDFFPEIAESSSQAYHHFLTKASAHANGLFCPQQVVAVSSEFCMVRRDYFSQAGYLDSDIFPTKLYDVDLCFQLQDIGLHHIFSPYCKATRKNGISYLKNGPDNGHEKVLFQKKWQQSLINSSPYISATMICHNTDIDMDSWKEWYAGKTL